MILDYHAHLPWDKATASYQSEALLDDMDQNGIDLRLVSALHGVSIQAQNNAVMDLVRAHPDKVLGCAVLNPKAVDCIEEAERIAESGLFVAIELDSLEHNYFPEEFKEEIDQILSIAARHHLLVNVYTGWGCRTMPAQWAYYAERFPEVKMVILHMGTTDFGYGCTNLIPKYENLYVETSCMYELPILRQAFQKIDNEHILFGSHYPHKFTRCSIDTFDLLNLSKEQKQKLYFDNAVKLLQLEGRFTRND